MKSTTQPSGIEQVLGEKEIIVSKTDLTGKLIYANKKFLEISGFEEKEILGKQHNIVRHPDMPRSIFQFLWDRLQAGKEIFAYVLNLSKNGDHYWVLADVTPSIDTSGKIVGYHSNRRAVDPDLIQKIIVPIYKKLVEIEASAPSPKQGLASSCEALENFIKDHGDNYDQWLFSL